MDRNKFIIYTCTQTSYQFVFDNGKVLNKSRVSGKFLQNWLICQLSPNNSTIGKIKIRRRTYFMLSFCTRVLYN